MKSKIAVSIVCLLAMACKLPSAAQAKPFLTTLYSFSDSHYNFTNEDGAYPSVALVEGTDGKFYGTTNIGGTSAAGTLFSITTAGALTTLHTFTGVGADGADPDGALALGRDGNFYGVTNNGGVNAKGTIFSITPGGVYTALYNFTGVGPDGSHPQAGLVQDVNGSFYGTTFNGGSAGGGTVFTVTPAGVLTTLYSFGGVSSDGAGPMAALVQGSDGNFYGTTAYGGLNNNGTVFQMTPAGVLTTLYSFSPLNYDLQNSDGVIPEGALVEGSDGNFYGTTNKGGQNAAGTIFVISPTGTLTTLHQFTFYVDGGKPSAGMIRGTDGNFYGTAVYGGSGESGTVFSITPAGVFTVLYTFGTADVTFGVDPNGTYPFGGLVLGRDGIFYGTTTGVGRLSGSVFKLQAGQSASVPTVTIGVVGSGATVEAGHKGEVLIQRTGSTDAAITVFYKAKGSAKAGVDYQALGGSVTIPAGAGKAKIKIKTMKNAARRGTAQLKVSLVPASDGSYALGDRVVAKLKIIGD